MNKFMQNMKAFMADEEGLTVVEYVVGAGLLVIALGTVFSQWGTTISTELSSVFGSSS
ncbi:Flp family type IVb pilin [Vibrio sonorensis]|uniref:Flp family type IVb pilin n=1 Tax=Vibrio sonorensis TaxID=1004316 RepID=UPI0008DA3268|nr:fimbrial protein [Vibrio sonorensis]